MDVVLRTRSHTLRIPNSVRGEIVGDDPFLTAVAPLTVGAIAQSRDGRCLQQLRPEVMTMSTVIADLLPRTWSIRRGGSTKTAGYDGVGKHGAFVAAGADRDASGLQRRVNWFAQS